MQVIGSDFIISGFYLVNVRVRNCDNSQIGLWLEVVVCIKAASEAMFEEVCGNKLQVGAADEDLWVEKILTFAQQQPDSAASSR